MFQTPQWITRLLTGRVDDDDDGAKLLVNYSIKLICNFFDTILSLCFSTEFSLCTNHVQQLDKESFLFSLTLSAALTGCKTKKG